MTTCDVPGCGHPVTDNAHLCHTCTAKLRRALTDVPALLDELEVTTLRQSTAPAWNGSSTGDALPYNLTSSITAGTLTGTVTVWAIHVARARGQIITPQPFLGPACRDQLCPHTSCRVIRDTRTMPPVAAAALWLARQVDWLRRTPDAAQAYDEIRYATGEARHAIDSRPDRWYAGPCGAQTIGMAVVAAVFGDPLGPCTAELYARPDATTITCPACYTRWDLAARRTWLLDAAQDALATAAVISSALTALDRPVRADRIRQWAHRGRLVAHARDTNPNARRPPALYRVGDVVALLAEPDRPARKREKMPA